MSFIKKQIFPYFNLFRHNILFIISEYFLTKKLGKGYFPSYTNRIIIKIMVNKIIKKTKNLKAFRI